MKNRTLCFPLLPSSLPILAFQILSSNILFYSLNTCRVQEIFFELNEEHRMLSMEVRGGY
jgi:hypothetical protein